MILVDIYVIACNVHSGGYSLALCWYNAWLCLDPTWATYSNNNIGHAIEHCSGQHKPPRSLRSLWPGGGFRGSVSDEAVNCVWLMSSRRLLWVWSWIQQHRSCHCYELLNLEHCYPYMKYCACNMHNSGVDMHYNNLSTCRVHVPFTSTCM
jgi:hypothetical protein